MDIKKDERIILTLDAGGTNFIFTAIQNNQQIIDSIRLPSEAHNLENCIENIISGFSRIINMLDQKPSAISFAFPGPADYSKGIIGNLPNFEAFNGNTPLGPILENKFQLPVFINNDGNLFAYGEALSGFLPEVNSRIIETGGIKTFNNLIGLTLGTGFGGGIVFNKTLVIGDSGCGAEVHNSLNKFNSDWNAEESVSTRAIQRVYCEESGVTFSDNLMPKNISDIAFGFIEGNQKAAIESFRQYGESLGSAIANIITLLDGIVVLGGGITASWELFAPAMFKEVNRKYYHFTGAENDRLSIKVFNLEDKEEFKTFALGKIETIKIPGVNKEIEFDNLPRTGISRSSLGASHAIALGAYTFALQQLDNNS